MIKENIKHLDNIEEIVAGDNCFLKEIFHPDRDEVKTNYSLAFAFVEPQGRTLNHCLKQSETYFIIAGIGRMHIDNDVFEVREGSSFYVAPFQNQWIENIGNDKLEFLVIVDPPWKKEDERITE